MDVFEYKVLTDKGVLRFFPRTKWHDGDQPLEGKLKDILPGLGKEGWEVVGVASGIGLFLVATFQVILKRKLATS